MLNDSTKKEFNSYKEDYKKALNGTNSKEATSRLQGLISYGMHHEEFHDELKEAITQYSQTFATNTQDNLPDNPIPTGTSTDEKIRSYIAHEMAYFPNEPTLARLDRILKAAKLLKKKESKGKDEPDIESIPRQDANGNNYLWIAIIAGGALLAGAIAYCIFKLK